MAVTDYKPTILDSSLIEDILDDDLAYDNQRITVERIYEASFTRQTSQFQRKLRTPKNAIYSLSDVYDKFRLAIENYESRANTPVIDKITFTEDFSDLENATEIISVSCQMRDPGMFAQGTPYDAMGNSKVKNLKPMLREEVNDPDHKGYKIAICGKWFDNVVRLTCWAKTNKRANYRADWLENLMDEYDWWFKSEGIDRVIYVGRKADEITDKNNNRWYGRPLDYFVRTEKISMRSEKQIEEILIKATVADE
jgi:hypothetical protein